MVWVLMVFIKSWRQFPECLTNFTDCSGFQVWHSRVRQLISQLIDIDNSDFKTLHYNSVSC